MTDFLDSEEFKEAWGMWLQHRKEIKRKITPSTEKLQLKKLAKFGKMVAIQAIYRSIENGWIGLFPESVKLEVQHPQSQTVEDAPLEEITRDQRAKNLARLRELTQTIGRKING
jgi:hypothetical protein